MDKVIVSLVSLSGSLIDTRGSCGVATPKFMFFGISGLTSSTLSSVAAKGGLMGVGSQFTIAREAGDLDGLCGLVGISGLSNAFHLAFFA